MSDEKDQKRSKMWLYLILAAAAVVIIILSMSMVGITVLDPQPFNNITLQVTIS